MHDLTICNPSEFLEPSRKVDYGIRNYSLRLVLRKKFGISWYFNSIKHVHMLMDGSGFNA